MKEGRMGKLRNFALLAGGLLTVGSVGCLPFSMGIFTPVPMPPWVTERTQEKYCNQNDHRTPILPPIRDGFPPPLCEDPPDEAAVLRALPHGSRILPILSQGWREPIRTGDHTPDT